MAALAAQPRKLIVGQLALALLLVDLVLLRHIPQLPDLLAFILFGTALGQLNLLGLWTAFGERLPLLRMAVLLAAMVAWASCLQFIGGPSRESLVGFYAVILVPLMALLWADRWRGRRWCGTDAGVPSPPRRNADVRLQSARRVRHQFTLGGLLVAVTALGLSLGTLRNAEIPGEFFIAVLLYCAGFLAVSLLSIVAFSMLPARSWTTLLLVMSVPVVGWAMGWIEPRGYQAHFVAAALAQAGTVAVGSQVVRIAGFRLAWLPAAEISPKSPLAAGR